MSTTEERDRSTQCHAVGMTVSRVGQESKFGLWRVNTASAVDRIFGCGFNVPINVLPQG